MRNIVMLHGWAARGAAFDGITAQLEDRYKCHTPDLPGHGSAANIPSSLAACRNKAAEIINGLGDVEILVVAWSMGAAVLWDLIREQGTNSIVGIVTIDMSPRWTNGEGWSHGIRGQGDDGPASGFAITQNWPQMAETIASKTMFASAHGSEIYPHDTVIKDTLECDPLQMAKLWDDLVAADYCDVVPHIEIPWLVICGGRSALFDTSASEWLVASAPKAQMLVFEDDGHAPHLESPARFLTALRLFENQL